MPYTVKRILVATDFSESSAKASDVGAELARATQASLTLLHVVDYYPIYAYAFEPPSDLLSQLEAAAGVSLEKELARVRAQSPAVTAALKTGITSDVILTFVADDATDLLVVGTHGRRGVQRWLLGSVAEKLVRLCQRPVLTVHGARDREPKG